MEQGIRKEHLGKGVEIFVSKQHRFGTDAILLADFSAPKSGETVCDLCTGCGIIPMLWQREKKFKKACGVEIQKDGAELFCLSVNENNADNINVINADLKNLNGILEAGTFDLVSCNPPYKADGTGIKSRDKSDLTARHESECTLNDVVTASASLLRFGGRLAVCQRPERLSDVIYEMRNAGIEPKRLRFVMQSQGKEPWLLLCEGKKGGGNGMRILPPLYMTENGEETEEVKRIYGDYSAGKGIQK